MAYCTLSDLYAYGLPRGALSGPSRLVDGVDTTTNSVRLGAHGFAAGDAVQFRGVGGGSIPTGLSESTTYYVLAVDDWRFQISATAGGSAVDLTSSGTTFAVLSPLPVDAAIDKAGRMIDDMCPSAIVPFADPVPDVVKMTTAELAAAELLALTGGESVALTAIYDAARKRIERWSRNAPIRGVGAPDTAQRSAGSAATSRSTPDWRRYGGIG